jgi:PST family polysaccharide transporter
MPLTGAQIIGNVGSKIFEMLVGIMMGPAALGFYRVGGRALYILQDVVLKPLESTILSALSRIDQHQHQALSVIRIIRMSCYITFPIFFGAAAIGPEFITFAFGEKWAMSGYIMTALAIGIAPLVISQQINAVLTASGNSRLVMVLAAITFVGNCIFGFVAIPFGLIATACAFSTRAYLTLFFNLFFFKRVYGFGILKVLKVTIPSFTSSVVMFAALFALKLFITNTLPPVLALIILCLSGGLVYALCIRMMFKHETQLFFIESIDLVPGKLKHLLGNIQRLIKLT